MSSVKYLDPAHLEYKSGSGLARLKDFIGEDSEEKVSESGQATSEANESKQHTPDIQLLNRIFGEQDWEDVADGFYTLTEHYEEISLEDGSKVFRELQDNYYPTKKEAEEALFNYAVKDKGLRESIESELEYI